MTVLEGLGYSMLPCAKVLSVAGFFDILLLFPLGRGVYSGGNSIPDIPRFITFLTVLAVLFVGAQFSSLSSL